MADDWLAPRAAMIPSAEWLAAGNSYLPHYSHEQEIIGVAVLGALIVFVVVAYVVVQRRRGR